MARPVKWSRDIHPIRERATRSRTETWSRQDIEALFGVGRASAQTLMKAIGEVQAVGGTHFIDRTSLLLFLDEMLAADSVEEAVRTRLEQAPPIPRPAPIQVSLPGDLRRITLVDLPANVEVQEGRVCVTGGNAEQVLEGLVMLAQAMQNDFESIRARLDPPPAIQTEIDDGLRKMLLGMRAAESTP